MSRLYGDIHRAMQMAFDTRTLADRLEGMIVKPEIDDVGKVFIASRDMFFLTTIDHNGRPTVSYKGGSPGFVRVLDASTLLFPSYDGNGMYLSMGNISGNPEIGMLFIDFEKPFRLRTQGRAELIFSGPNFKNSKTSKLKLHFANGSASIRCKTSCGPQSARRLRRSARLRSMIGWAR